MLRRRGRIVDARRTLAAGGAATAVAGIAVLCTFAVSHAVALTDVAAEPVSASPVVLPSASSSPTPTVPTATTPPEALVVPPPEPRDVAPPSSAPKAAEPVQQAAADPGIEEIIAQFERDGDWKKVAAWFAAHRDDPELATWWRYVRDHLDESQLDEDGHRFFDKLPETPHAGNTSGRHHPDDGTGSKRERSRTTPDRRD